MTQGEPQPTTNLKPFPCRKCGTLIQPPEILPPVIIGGKVRGEIHIQIIYDCEKCGVKHRTFSEGRIFIDDVVVKMIET